MGGVWYQDHGNIEVDPAYADGLQGVKTSPGDLGLSILMGTAEGRGPLFGMSGAVGRLNRLSGRGKALYHRFPGKKSGQDFHPVFRTQGPKFSFIEIARGVEGRAFFLFQ